MSTHWKWTALQQAADEIVVRQTLKLSGIFSTIFGVLAILGGITPPTDVLLLSVGAVLALTGLWNLTNPHAIGLALSAGALIVVGLYNIASTFMDSAAGGTPHTGWAVVGVWQIIWGVQGFARFNRFRQVFETQSSDADRAEARRMLDALKRANVKSESDVISYPMSGLQPKLVKARLMPDAVLCLIGGGDDVQIVPRNDFSVEPVDAAKPGQRNVKVRVRMGSVTTTTSVGVELVRRYEAWKNPGREMLPKAA